MGQGKEVCTEPSSLKLAGEQVESGCVATREASLCSQGLFSGPGYEARPEELGACGRQALSEQNSNQVVDMIFDLRKLRPAYQPIVDLYTKEVIGFEALARWPGVGVAPTEAFRRAAAVGKLVELDRTCGIAALSGALAAGLPKELTLFVNMEPSSAGLVLGGPELDTVSQATQELQVVLEITERSLMVRPARLLITAKRVRELGWGLALDDVGSNPASLALLPFLRPDVVKLDLSLVQGDFDRESLRVVAAVGSYAEAHGATVLAEGIETEEHLEKALAFGAQLGQGWRFGRPGPLGWLVVPRRNLIVRQAPDGPVASSPFDLVKGSSRLQVARQELLLAVSRHIEERARRLAAPVVLGAFQRAERFSGPTALSFGEMGRRFPLVAAFGVGMKPDPVPGVRGVSLDPSDSMAKEWVVAVVGAFEAAALIALDLGDDGPEMDKRYVFLLTHDRELVAAAGRSMLVRLEAAMS